MKRSIKTLMCGVLFLSFLCTGCSNAQDYTTEINMDATTTSLATENTVMEMENIVQLKTTTQEVNTTTFTTEVDTTEYTTATNITTGVTTTSETTNTVAVISDKATNTSPTKITNSPVETTTCTLIETTDDFAAEKSTEEKNITTTKISRDISKTTDTSTITTVVNTSCSTTCSVTTVTTAATTKNVKDRTVYKPSTHYIHRMSCHWYDNTCYEITSTEGIECRRCTECNPAMEIITQYTPKMDTPTYTGVNANDRDYLAQIVYHEAGSNWISLYDKAKICAGVMNRVRDSRFPNTVYSVLTQPGQFTGFYPGYCTPPSSCYEAVDYYFSHQNEFNNDNSWWGDGRQNHFYYQ